MYMIQLFVCHLGIFGASYEPLFMGFTIIPKRRGVPRCSKAPGIGMPKIETPVSRIYAKEVEEMVRRSAVVHIDQKAASLDLASCIHFFSFFG